MSNARANSKNFIEIKVETIQYFCFTHVFQEHKNSYSYKGDDVYFRCIYVKNIFMKKMYLFSKLKNFLNNLSLLIISKAFSM